ncbi:hypothetical protein [Mesorhizobium sp. CN2-181]|uniref:hypothetical protein n=1 Tax=Mesorhizobium yinganensis TaxID=3157707 RepID=UPI0032B84C01
MPIKRRRSKRRAEGLPEEVEAHLLGDPEHRYLFFYDDHEIRFMWDDFRDVLLGDWIAEHPGTRPWAWWKYDTLENRLRIGGKGTATHDALAAVAARFEMGLPACGYVDRFLHDYYNGVAVDIRGNWIVNGYKPGDFVAEVYDPADPPTFESEVEYLARLGLLFDGEAARCQ